MKRLKGAAGAWKSVGVAVSLAVAMVACSTTEEQLPENPLEHFEKAYKIKAEGKVDFEDLDILNPVDLVSTRKWIATIDIGRRDGLVCFVSKDMKRVVRGLSIGQGPHDLTDVMRLSVRNDTVFVIDLNLRKVMSLAVKDDSVVVNSVNTGILCGWSSSMLSGDRYLMPTMLDSLLLKMTNGKGELLSSVDYPDDKVLMGYDYAKRNSIYRNTTLAVSPDEKCYAYGVMAAETYGFGRIEGEKLVPQKTYIYSSPKIGHVYDDPQVQALVPDKEESKVNVISMAGTKDYVVFAYSGAKYGHDGIDSSKALLFYRWDGTPMFRMVLDTPVSFISYDASRKVLMGISYTPEAQYVEYDLKDVDEL